MKNAKRKAGIMPVRFDQGTGPGVVGDAPQLQYIDPNSTQVQYTAPTPMGLDTAQAAMQKLYGPGQDYSDALSQIQALQGRIKPAGDWGSDLMNFGARFAGGQNLGQAASGVMTDNRSINQQNLNNTMALMKARQAIQAEQQKRADEIAGKSDTYAQDQTQNGINAAKTQYDVDKNNTAGRIGAIEHNNSTAQAQQGLDLRQNAAMADLGQVNAMKQQAFNAANAATDPAAKAAAMQRYNQLDAASKQIVTQQQQELDMKLKNQEANEDYTFAHQKELAGINAANQQKLFGMKQGMKADGTFDPAYIKAVANYELDPPSNRDPAYKFVMAQVHQVNGDYRPEQMSVIKKARLGFTTGTQGDSARQLNNVIQHADIAYQMNEALHNGNFRPGTDIYNRVLNTWGSDAVTNPKIALHYLSSEAGKSLAGRSGGTEEERKAVSDIANIQSGSYNQVKGALGTTIRLVGSQARNLNEQYKQAVGPTRSGDHFSVIYPESRDVLSRHGFDPDTMAPTAASSNNFTPAPSGSTLVTDPQGKPFYVKNEKLDAALKRGFKKAQ